MRKDQLSFLLGGLVFGILLGYGLFHAIENRPRPEAAPAPAAAEAEVPGPQGPMAATQSGPAAGAPMMEEVNALKRALQADPKNFQAAARLGNLYYDIGQWTQAAMFYEKAVEIEPQNADVLTDLGVCYQQLQDYEKATDRFRRASRANPQHWQSLYNLAVVSGLAMGRFDEADDALRRLEQLNPQAPHLDELKKSLQDARTKGGKAS